MTETAVATQSRTRRSPDKGYAGPGAVRQHGAELPVYICNTCGREVVWCESKRTGRKYLADVFHGYHDQRFYIGANVHPRGCMDAVNAEADRQAHNAAVTARCRTLLTEARIARDSGDEARCTALCAESVEASATLR